MIPTHVCQIDCMNAWVCCYGLSNERRQAQFQESRKVPVQSGFAHCRCYMLLFCVTLCSHLAWQSGNWLLLLSNVQCSEAELQHIRFKIRAENHTITNCRRHLCNMLFLLQAKHLGYSLGTAGLCEQSLYFHLIVMRRTRYLIVNPLLGCMLL